VDYSANCLKIGDNLAAKEGNEEDVDFYVVLCTQPIHVVKEDFTDAWSTKFIIGDVVVARTYYQTWDKGDTSYVFL
jgi:hypothetical protein